MSASSSKPSLLLLVWLCLAALVGGCTRPVATSSVELFSRGVTTTTKNTRQGLILVTDTERRAALLAETEKYIANDPFTLEPEVYVTPDILNSRFAALNALQEYARYLSAISGNQQGARVSGAIRGAGQALGSTLQAGLPMPQVASVNPVVVEGAVDGLSELAELLVNAKINRALPEVIEEMHSSIKKIVAWMKADVGQADTGLRKILRLRLAEIEMGRETLLARYREDKRVSTVELSNLYQKAVSEAVNARALDMALVQVVRALDEMQQAHQALIDPDAASTLTRVEQFLSITEQAARVLPARI